MEPDARVAVYYAPQPADPLFVDAARWLGRDPESGAALPQPPILDIADVTAEPRLYGFHATLKPPMRLAAGCGWSDVLAAARSLADRIAPFDLPPMTVQDVFGFLALRETAPCAPLRALADVCVEHLDRFRAPPSEAELARRRRANLTPPQDSMLTRWGYPYVFDTWFFHMTLTRRLSAGEKEVFMPAAQAYFAQVIATPRRVSDICLFVQASSNAPFVIRERLRLRSTPPDDSCLGPRQNGYIRARKCGGANAGDVGEGTGEAGGT
jgi:putative phosphonate metabolism protein